MTRMMGTRATTAVTTPRGWQLASTESLKARHRPTSIHHGRGFLGGHQVVLATGNKMGHRRAALVLIPLLRPHKVGPFCSHNSLQRPRRAIRSRPW